MAAIPRHHVVDDNDADDLAPEPAERGIRGAAGGVYVGPTQPNSTSHGAGGGVEDTSGYRESDTYDATEGTSGLTGADQATTTTVARPTGRTAYIADGVQGGSTPGKPIDTTGRAEDTGVDRFGRTGQPGHLTYTNFDGRANLGQNAGRPLGASGRGSMESSGETVTYASTNRPNASARPGVNASRTATIARPVIGGAANPSAGTVGVIAGTGKFTVDLNAADVSGGARGLKGVRVVAFKRKTDTDEDGALAGIVDFDSTTEGDGVTGLAAGTYAVYARFRYVGNAGQIELGPRSLRGTVVVS